ncbi:MAG: ABC transporter permease [Oscillospiraceae bacterium]|nr:ABC transporter permease [Oscillospiraceae bacterium]
MQPGHPLRGIVSGAGLLLGTALSYTVLPSVASVLAVQSGVSYAPVFDPGAACISVCGILVFVLLFTVLAAGKIRRLEPINAIRGIDPLKPAPRETRAMQAMYTSLITVVALLLFVITVLIVLLILYVIMRSMTSGLKTDFGIYKAMGFTSRQLIVQTVGRITPVVLLGSVLSAVLGIVYLPVMFDGIFSVIGAQKNHFEIPVAVLLLMAVLLTAVNIVIGAVLCRPIRKITAYSLIREG